MPITSVPSHREWTSIMGDIIEYGIPNPMTRPKLKANVVVANSSLVIRPSRYSGTTGLTASLKTAIPLLAKSAPNAPAKNITI